MIRESSFDRWLQSDPRDDEWADFEAYCAEQGIDPCDENGEVDEDAWNDYQDACLGDPEPDEPEPDDDAWMAFG